MGPSPITFVLYTLVVLVLNFHQLAARFRLRPTVSIWLYTVLTISMFGALGYGLADVTIDLVDIIYTWPKGGSEFLEKGLWTWVRLGTAVIVAVGIVLLSVYRQAGGWASIKQNILAELEKAKKAEHSEKEETKGARTWAIYSFAFMYSRAVLDFALWAKEMIEQGAIDKHMVPPIWHSLGPFAVVGTLALSRSGWVRQKAGLPNQEIRGASVEKTVFEKVESIA